MPSNNKWKEIQKLLNQCHSDLKEIQKDLTKLENALKIRKNALH
jgi:peptidoglycan hydrolase CwlO-like protein